MKVDADTTKIFSSPQGPLLEWLFRADLPVPLSHYAGYVSRSRLYEWRDLGLQFESVNGRQCVRPSILADWIRRLAEPSLIAPPGSKDAA